MLELQLPRYATTCMQDEEPHLIDVDPRSLSQSLTSVWARVCGRACHATHSTCSAIQSTRTHRESQALCVLSRTSTPHYMHAGIHLLFLYAYAQPSVWLLYIPDTCLHTWLHACPRICPYTISAHLPTDIQFFMSLSMFTARCAKSRCITPF